LDRHSGRGWRKPMKKRGGGAGNWGDYRDELKADLYEYRYVEK